MADIVDLNHYRATQLEKKAFRPWRKRLGERYTRETRLGDLSDNLLYLLARPGEAGAVLYYELIMGALELGNPMKFYYLDDDERMRVIDIHLFLADQVRLEMFFRLEWLASYPAAGYCLLDMIVSFQHVKDACKKAPPVLAATHPRFAEYNQQAEADKEVFIRRLLPEALEAFQKAIS